MKNKSQGTLAANIPQPGGTQDGLISDVMGWLAHPFSTNGSALNWVLFVGLLVIAAWFWNHVLLSIGE